jgi:hypothetical protein
MEINYGGAANACAPLRLLVSDNQIALSSARRHALEQVLVAKDQASIVDLEVSLETCRDPEVHVAYPIRAEAVVSLT